MCHNTIVKHFTSKDVKKLFPGAVERTYPAGQIVVYVGDQPAHMFFIQKGALKNYDIDDNGSEKILSIIGELGFFSILYGFANNEKEISSFYSTLEETELLLIPMEDFLKLMSTDIQFTNRLFKWFVAETDFVMGRIKGLEKTEGRLKVAQALEYLATRHGVIKSSGWSRVKFPINQQLLADLVGLTRETVSMVMKDFDEQKVIRYPKQMILEVNQKKLARINSSN